VGATPLTRSMRQVSLTPADAIYVAFARRALHLTERAQENLRTLRTELTGLIRLTAPVSWGQRVLGPLLPAFLAQHPGLEIEFLLADRLMDLADERIDLALRMSAFTPPDLVSIPLTRLDWVICATPSCLAGTTVRKEPAVPAQHPCLN